MGERRGRGGDRHLGGHARTESTRWVSIASPNDARSRTAQLRIPSPGHHGLRGVVGHMSGAATRTSEGSSAKAGWPWTLGAALVGFAASFTLSGVLHLPRGVFVLGYAVIACALFVAYAISQHVNLLTQVRRRWIAGAVGGLVIGLLLVRQVLGQPASARSAGLALAGDVVWYGVVYGIVDALLLSVIPVLALYGARPSSELARGAARLRWAVVALIGSVLVTSAYHLGFVEFRGPRLVQPIIGTSVITLAYLLTGNPLAAIISHVLMHVAAVLHGMATTAQLPPHY
jgi:hypothetical protein